MIPRQDAQNRRRNRIVASEEMRKQAEMEANKKYHLFSRGRGFTETAAFFMQFRLKGQESAIY
jgi:hypothetical protein